MFEFVKDAYGCPYIPGSSIKGMLRTALLTNLAMQDRNRYLAYFNRENVRKGRGSDRSIMREAFWVERPDPSDESVLNDIMRFVSVSDSEPLSPETLTFAQKYDLFSRTDDERHKKSRGRAPSGDYYAGNELCIYRECLKPGTEVRASLSVDERIDAHLGFGVLDNAKLHELLDKCFALYKERFLDKFDDGSDAHAASGAGASADGRCAYIVQEGPLAGMRCRNAALARSEYCRIHQGKALEGNTPPGGSRSSTCYLGGGVDFDSKTIVNALFSDGQDSVNEISRILAGQFPTKLDPQRHRGLREQVEEAGFEAREMKAVFRNGRPKKAKEDHRHWKDGELGVSPHTMKMGLIGSEKLPMGKCSIRIEGL